MQECILAALGVLLCAGTLGAQPVVRVRAEARIELGAEWRDGEMVLRGNLRDDLGEPLPRRPLTLDAFDAEGSGLLHRSVRTDAEGAFEVRAPTDLDTYRARAEFGGDETHDPVQVERLVRVGRANVQLTLALPSGGHLDLDAPAQQLEVRARCAAGVGGLRIELRDELDRRLGEGVTGEDGRVRLRVSSADLGAPGPGRLRVRFPGDARRAEAQTEVPIVRERSTMLTLAATRRRARVGDPVELRGTLRDSQGPLARRAVGIFAAGTHRGTVLTDTRGSFRWQTRLTSKDDGRDLVFQARFEGDGPGHRTSASAPVTIATHGTRRARWAWSLLPLGLCALLLLWLRRREEVGPPPPRREPRAGVVHTQPKRKRARSRRFAGVLVDARDGGRIAGAVRLEGPQQLEGPVDTAGFSFELPDGAWTATFDAPGRAPVTETFRTPHGGEWDRVEVHLETWRARALAVFRRWVRRRAPELPWRKHTLRELRRGLPPAERALGEEVERAYYGPEPPDAEEVRSIAARAEELAGSDGHDGR